MSIDALVAIPIGLLIGPSMGALGGGGGVLVVPALVIVFREPVHSAISASLVIVGLAAALGTAAHARVAEVRWRTGALIAAGGALPSIVGAAVSARADPDHLLAAVALLTHLAAVAMLRSQQRDTVRTATHPVGPLRSLGAGTALGFVTGLLGVGGGFLAVPTLTAIVRLTVRDAIGTGLLVITINAAISFFAHAAMTSFSWAVAAPLTIAALIGVVVGTRTTQRAAFDPTAW